jgi:hypothetical protein
VKRWLLALCFACLVSSTLDAGNSGSLTPGGVTEEQVQTLIDARVPYLSYVAELSQTGTDDPTVDAESENNTGGTVTWSRDGLGVYTAHFSGLSYSLNSKFVADITGVIMNPTTDGDGVMGFWRIAGGGSSAVALRVRDFLGALSDDKLSRTTILIRIYEAP